LAGTVDVHGWKLDKIGWFVIIPFVIADFGNILGGLFTQYIIKRNTAAAGKKNIRRDLWRPDGIFN